MLPENPALTIAAGDYIKKEKAGLEFAVFPALSSPCFVSVQLTPTLIL